MIFYKENNLTDEEKTIGYFKGIIVTTNIRVFIGGN